jgi:hypothetical protein
LYKPLEWGNEEEVRVVKNIKSPFVGYYEKGRFKNSAGEWDKIIIPKLGRPIYCLSIPSDSIREIFMGENVYENVSRLGSVLLKQNSHLLRKVG